MTTFPPSRDLSGIAAFLETTPFLRRRLEIVASLGLPDSWIGAGFIRNAVWDVLHGRPPQRRRDDDVDVIFFDAADTGEECDRAIERRLGALAPETVWSVKNQARMHLRNGDRPYRDSLDAVAHWPETATAIAARLHHGAIEAIAPYDVEDLFNFMVRPTPAFRDKMVIYRERLRSKDWPSRWPRLRLIQNGPEASGPIVP